MIVARRAETGFRFHPPPLARSSELEWVLRAAFSLSDRGRPADPAAAVRLALGLEIGPRIAHLLGAERLNAQLSGEAQTLLKARRATVAMSMTLKAAVEACLDAGTTLRIPIVPLKGTALDLRGTANAAVRPRADGDLLVPEAAVAVLQAYLLSHGFRHAGGAAYEHQAPAILHLAGGAIELHRCLPGVRLDGRRAATFADCERAGLLEPLRAPGRAVGTGVGGSEPAPHFLPRRPLLAAHLLAHALAQDAFSPQQVGLRWLADAWDLDQEARRENDDGLEEDLRDLRPALRGALSSEEIEAALGCLGALREERLDELFDPARRPAQLLAHVVLGSTHRDYAESLRLRSFERPLSDRPRAWARLAAVWAALWPGRRTGETVEPWSDYLARLAHRPAYLFERWRLARQGRKRLEEPRGELAAGSTGGDVSLARQGTVPTPEQPPGSAENADQDEGRQRR